MNEPTDETLAQRLEQLERENRWMKRIGSLMLVGLVVLVLMGQAQCNLTKTGTSQSSKIVEAQEFIVRDANGKPRAKLTDSMLVFTNPDGNATITLSAGDLISFSSQFAPRVRA